jgi:hypothetical protein
MHQPHRCTRCHREIRSKTLDALSHKWCKLCRTKANAWADKNLRSTEYKKSKNAKMGALHRSEKWLTEHQNDKPIMFRGYINVVCLPQFKSMASVNGTVREHRQVVALSINRPLTSKEVVHHKDANRSNNSPNNLVLYATEKEHHLGSSPIWDGALNGEDVSKLRKVWTDIFTMCMGA